MAGLWAEVQRSWSLSARFGFSVAGLRDMAGLGFLGACSIVYGYHFFSSFRRDRFVILAGAIFIMGMGGLDGGVEEGARDGVEYFTSNLFDIRLQFQTWYVL